MTCSRSKLQSQQMYPGLTGAVPHGSNVAEGVMNQEVAIDLARTMHASDL